MWLCIVLKGASAVAVLAVAFEPLLPFSTVDVHYVQAEIERLMGLHRDVDSTHRGLIGDLDPKKKRHAILQVGPFHPYMLLSVLLQELQPGRSCLSHAVCRSAGSSVLLHAGRHSAATASCSS